MLKPDGTHIIGIDLGTTYSVAADVIERRPVVLPNSLGETLTPSAVSVDESGVLLVGAAAKARALRHPARTATCFKRDMGTSLRHRLGEQEFSPVELSALVLASIKADAEAALSAPVSEAVITVPAYFGDAQRQATRDAARISGLLAERIINEPTAAALAYGFHRKEHAGRVAVFDLGGGTFDVSLLNIDHGVIEVLASSGDTRLGGEDFTRALIPSARAALGLDEQSPLLLELAESMKRRLSSLLSAEVSPAGAGGRTWALSRRDAERLWLSLLDRLEVPIRQALLDAGLKAQGIDEVLLVGGATRLPSVQRLIESLMGKSSIHSLPPDEAIALGAAVQAALKVGDSSVEDLVATDIAPFSLGIETVQSVRGRLAEGLFTPVLERGTVLPASRAKRFFSMHPQQTTLEVKVLQGEHSLAQQNTLLGAYRVEGLPSGAINEVEIRLSYDLNGILEVETTVLATGNRSSLVVTEKPNSLTAAEIERAVARFATLKVHPRELLPNRTALERGESLYVQLLGEDRDKLGAFLAAFRVALDTGEEVIIADSRAALLAVLSRLAV